MRVLDRQDTDGQAVLEYWYLKVLGCPQCKSPLINQGKLLRCDFCGVDYATNEGIPVLLSPTLKTALRQGEAEVKDFYFEKERYDWTSDPRFLELAYHRFRKWETWRQVIKRLRPESVVLDVGCGTGLITREFRKIEQRVIALDLNQWALSQMDGKPFVAKVVGDGELLPIQDASIDLIVATETVEHMEAPQKTVSEIFRVCKPGGTVVSSVPSTSNVWNWRQHLSLTCGGGEPFHHNYTKEEVSQLWSQAGFQVEVSASCLGLNWLCIMSKY